MRTIALLITGLMALSVLAIPGTQAHAAPPEREYETRALHDHNDDSLIVLAGKHGFDSIALDLREEYSPVLGENVLVFRLTLNNGCNDAGQTACDILQEIVQFSVDGSSHALAFNTTDDGATWSGDMDLYGEPEDLNDGTRFAIEGKIRFSRLGIEPGSELTDWFVEGFADGEEADHMPAGATNEKSTNDPLDAAKDIGTYTVRAPDYYLDLALGEGNTTIGHDETRSYNLTIANPLGTAQDITVFGAAAGTDVRFYDADADAESSVYEVDLAAEGNKTVEVRVTNQAEDGGDANLTIAALTGLGGRTDSTVSLSLEAKPMMHHDDMIVSEDLETDGVFEHTFHAAGTFHYHSHHNPRVTGVVEIMPSEGDASQTHDIDYVEADNEHGAAFDPESLTIHAGDTVRWTNGAPEVLMVMGSMGSMDHGDHDHGDHMDEEDTDEEAPGLPLLGILASLALVIMARKRHASSKSDK